MTIATLAVSLATVSVGFFWSSWQSGSPCVDDCTSDVLVIDVLKSQLARCGPEHLHKPAVIRGGTTISTILVPTYLAYLLGLVRCRSRRHLTAADFVVPTAGVDSLVLDESNGWCPSSGPNIRRIQQG